MRRKQLFKGVCCCLPLLMSGCFSQGGREEIVHSAYVPQGYTLAFADEFNKDGWPDPEIWGFDLGPWPYNEELECYTEENAVVAEGCLSIEARAEERDGCAYTSARLKTEGKKDFLYGYLEIRAAVPTGRGAWSAIWMLPSSQQYGGYLKSGEIDILEHVGFQPLKAYATLHMEENNALLGNAVKGETRLSGEAFHVYALLWQKDSIRIFVDGRESLAYQRPEDGGSGQWPFDLPFHLVMNVAVGGSWGGAEGVDDSAFPQSMLVDYVRYYTAD